MSLLGWIQSLLIKLFCKKNDEINSDIIIYEEKTDFQKKIDRQFKEKR